MAELMLNRHRLTQRAWRLLNGRKSYRDLSDKQWTLAASEKSDSPAAFFLPDGLERVTGVQEETTLDHEMVRIRGGVREHGATVAYRIRDVWIQGGHAYSKALKIPLTVGGESWRVSGRRESLAEATLACSLNGNKFFAHWMTDDLTAALAARHLTPPIRVNQQQTIHQKEYTEVFDVRPATVENAHIRELICLDDVGQNRFKRERYQYLRSRLKPFAQQPAPGGIMILRGTTGVRRLLINEQSVAAFLERRGYTIIDAAQMSVPEIGRLAVGASVLVGVEGSHLVHGLYGLREGGAIVTLQPPQRFNHLFKDYTDCLGMKYGFVVGKPANDGFEIVIDELAKTLDMIEQSWLDTQANVREGSTPWRQRRSGCEAAAGRWHPLRTLSRRPASPGDIRRSPAAISRLPRPSRCEVALPQNLDASALFGIFIERPRITP